MRISWQNKWFETESEARAFIREIWDSAWGVELRKVNKANRTYTTGYTLRWYWKDAKSWDDEQRERLTKLVRRIEAAEVARG